ncbi:Protein of unknown function [Poseidonocella pacifica]|uniref:K+-transporting ATPase, A chain n=1 Tax=Poseidonocella pacifica TaxID=871651 RepID=A0A1I0WNT7_9RHOB|nr:DUF2834 domain-containing protein [Poseidonocella pacifica]SFA90445.1 Protein of unknown function [Poseidonocella pacifica]
MSPLRLLWLLLAIWGAVHPLYWAAQWFAGNPWSLGSLLEGWTANAASRGLAWDLMIAAIALTLWIISEVAVRRNFMALLAIPATFLVGVSCGLPLYLFLRARPL